MSQLIHERELHWVAYIPFLFIGSVFSKFCALISLFRRLAWTALWIAGRSVLPSPTSQYVIIHKKEFHYTFIK